MPKPLSEAARWRERRDNYVSLGFHPKVAGALALQWLDGGAPPEMVNDGLGPSPKLDRYIQRQRGTKR